MISDTVDGRLWTEIKNLVLTHKLFPAEGYMFKQNEVAEFWKEVFSEKGITVFGSEEVPAGLSVIQADFELPDEPPCWLLPAEEE